jgi:predicted oxidoreductase
MGDGCQLRSFPASTRLGHCSISGPSGRTTAGSFSTERSSKREFALSGSEQNPDITGKSVRAVLRRATSGVPGPVQAFVDHGEDFVVAHTLRELVDRMNKVTPTPLLDFATVESEVLARDREMANRYSKDLQIAATRGARSYIGDRLTRIASPHRLLDPSAGPLIGVRLSVLTRKTLGGIETNLDSQVLGLDHQPIPGLYAAGEVAGFGGGGMHGYRALEGTFLGGCLFSGRQAGRAAARDTA